MKMTLCNIRRVLGAVVLLSALSACSVFETTPTPPPAPTHHAQEVVRAQTTTLTKIGTVSADALGSPMDVERAIKHKADEAGAHYYLILLVSDSIRPGRWYSEAILYK
ncbi:bioflm peroxide resistance protein BsmA [Rouxiella silvae]|uniref:Biofilm peroxide resistance protein BsmA n=1 Tax=Rouxiella silvae TaxID=1646373 RepID=A0AA40X0E3_9GAMM|nr:biofilm peroxide resistance protein BsmA [Rouxiella silvae]KQN43619.1 biofilm stress and motility protein A [Serratia sp. Leaf50]MBF6636336.1 biofilm peroxide resistance protein BsmA [Rouxiella silvae]ORJ19586.1 bioflm peroxide resistance protein BsmA [Rouxiella silvae]